MTTDNTQESKLHMLDYWQVLRNRYGIILLAFFLVFLTAASLLAWTLTRRTRRAVCDE